MSPEKAATQAANWLMFAFKSIVPDNYSVAAGSFRAGPSGQSFMLKPESLAAISSAARKLAPFLDYFPLEQCFERLASYVVEEKDAGTPLPQVHDRLRKKILLFVQGFASQGEWEVVYAVRAVDCSEGPFTVGPCRVYQMDEQQFRLWGRRRATGRYDPPGNAPLSESWFRQEGALQGQIVAAARIQAIDHEHARAKGRRRIEEVLNVLRYAQLAIGFPEKPFPEVGLSVPQWWEDHSIVIQLDKPNFGTNKTSVGPVGSPLSISREAPGWNGLEHLLTLDVSARSELQLRLTTALEWIGQAALAPSAPIRLVALVTALEALLIEESESLGKKTKLANRVSRLIGQSEGEQQPIAKEVEEVYETRSECVHAGMVDVEKGALLRTVRLVARVVEAILTRPPYCAANSLEDMLTYIDQPSARQDEARSRWVAEQALTPWGAVKASSGQRSGLGLLP
jgi:hypothetical protein